MDDISIGRIKTLIYTDTYAKDGNYTKYVDPVNHWIKDTDDSTDSKLVLELRGINCNGDICTGKLPGSILRFDIDDVARSLRWLIISDSDQNFYEITNSRYHNTFITLNLKRVSGNIYFDYLPTDIVALILSKFNENVDVDNYCLIKHKYCDKYIWKYILNQKYKSYITEIVSEYKKYLPNIDYRQLSKNLNDLNFNSELNYDKLLPITFDKDRIIRLIINKIKLRKFYPHLYEIIKDNDDIIASASAIPTLNDGIYSDYFRYGILPKDYEFDYGILQRSLLSIILLEPDVLYDLTDNVNFRVAEPKDRNVDQIARILTKR